MYFTSYTLVSSPLYVLSHNTSPCFFVLPPPLLTSLFFTSYFEGTDSSFYVGISRMGIGVGNIGSWKGNACVQVAWPSKQHPWRSKMMKYDLREKKYKFLRQDSSLYERKFHTIRYIVHGFITIIYMLSIWMPLLLIGKFQLFSTFFSQNIRVNEVNIHLPYTVIGSNITVSTLLIN